MEWANRSPNTQLSATPFLEHQGLSVQRMGCGGGGNDNGCGCDRSSGVCVYV